MYHFKEQIESEIKRVEHLRKNLKSFDEELLKGSVLSVNKKDGKASFLRENSRVDGGQRVKKRERILDFDGSKLKAVAEARYLNRLSGILDGNKKLLEKMLLNYQPYSKADVMALLPHVYKDALLDVNSYIITPSSGNMKKGVNGTKDTQSFTTKHFAVNGEPVRSKNEAIIYNMLMSYDVPFVYEKPLRILDEAGMRIEILPDFTIMTHDGKIIIFEHFGMLNNEDYRVNFANKLYLYTINGFVLWKNLFITTNGEGNSIDSASIDEMIRNCILPKVR